MRHLAVAEVVVMSGLDASDSVCSVAVVVVSWSVALSMREKLLVPLG